MSKNSRKVQFNYSKFEELRASKGVTKKFIADKLGRLPAICQDWKYGKSSPNAEQLKIIAGILDTTPEYLLGKTDKKQKPVEVDNPNRIMFWDVFVEQSHMRGLSPNAVAKELGIPSGSITAWKNGAIPRGKTIVMLSDFFGISVNDFFQKQKPTDNGEPKSDLDIKFNEIWDTFSEEQKKATIEFMKMFKK